MSRFADKAATGRMSLGACQCPGTPHDEDWISLRTELGAGDMEPVSQGNMEALAHLIVDWNLLDNDGSKATVDREHIERLFPDAFTTFEAWIDENLRVAATVPNAPSASSPSSSRGSGSRIRPLKKAG